MPVAPGTTPEQLAAWMQATQNAQTQAPAPTPQIVQNLITSPYPQNPAHANNLGHGMPSYYGYLPNPNAPPVPELYTSGWGSPGNALGIMDINNSQPPLNTSIDFGPPQPISGPINSTPAVQPNMTTGGYGGIWTDPGHAILDVNGKIVGSSSQPAPYADDKDSVARFVPPGTISQTTQAPDIPSLMAAGYSMFDALEITKNYQQSQQPPSQPVFWGADGQRYTSEAAANQAYYGGIAAEQQALAHAAGYTNVSDWSAANTAAFNAAAYAPRPAAVGTLAQPNYDVPGGSEVYRYTGIAHLPPNQIEYVYANTGAADRNYVSNYWRDEAARQNAHFSGLLYSGQVAPDIGTGWVLNNAGQTLNAQLYAAAGSNIYAPAPKYFY